MSDAKISEASLSKATVAPGETVTLTAQITAGSEAVPVTLAAGSATKMLRLEVVEPAPVKWVAVRAANGAVRLIDAVNPTATSNPPGAPYDAARGPNQLAAYLKALRSGANKYGYEVAVGDDGTVLDAAVNVASLVPVTILSEHNQAGQWWLRTNAPKGSRLELLTTTPAPVPSPTPTPSPAPGKYPAREIAIYRKCWPTDGPNASTLPAAANVLRLGFLQGDPPKMTGHGRQGKASLLADLRALRGRGVISTLSAGGSKGVVSISDPTRFVDGTARSIDTDYEGLVDAFDWDLEAVAMGPTAVKIGERLNARYPGMVFSFAPSGSDIEKYLPIVAEYARQGLLASYGQQFYEGDKFITVGMVRGRIEQAIKAGVPVDKIGVGCMLGTGPKYWTLDQAKEVVTMASKEFGVTRTYLWDLTSPLAARWADAMAEIVGA